VKALPQSHTYNAASWGSSVGESVRGARGGEGDRRTTCRVLRPGASFGSPGSARGRWWRVVVLRRGIDRRTVGSMARPIFRRAVLATLAPAAFLAAPATAGALSYDPPSWFKNAMAKVKARPGAECPGPKTTTRTYRFTRSDGTVVVTRRDLTTEDCVHRLPKALAKTFPMLRPPNDYGPYREGCHGEFEHLTRSTMDPGSGEDQVFYRCNIFSRPVIRGRPNVRSWHCFRWRWAKHNYAPDGQQRARTGKPSWLASETKYWREQRFRSLSRCLNPKYRKPR
jgi:hypothetical protein